MIIIKFVLGGSTYGGLTFRKRIEEKVKQMLKDPLTIKELTQLRNQGRSEMYIQHWLREMAKITLK